MAEQIIVFKNGERVITQLQEVFEGEGDDKRGICLLMSHPYILELISSDDPNSKMDLQVKFSKWCPYSIENSFRIPYDGILTIGQPDPGLTQAYMAKVDASKGADIPESQPASGSDDSPNWQQQQQLVKQAVAEASQPPAVTPEVV